jgi:hypothetical protein
MGRKIKKQLEGMKMILTDFIMKEMHMHMCKPSSSAVNSVNTTATAGSSNFLMFVFVAVVPQTFPALVAFFMKFEGMLYMETTPVCSPVSNLLSATKSSYFLEIWTRIFI